MTAQDVRRYRLEENEALDGRQVVSIKDSTSGKTIWTKTRELEDDEIVSTVFDSLHHPRWRISRPTQGWYLILQRSTSRGADEPYIELKAAKKQAGAASDKDGLELVFTVATPPAQLAPPAANSSDKETKAERRKSSVTVDMSPSAEPLFNPLTSPSLSTTASSSAAPSPDPQKTPTKSGFPATPTAGDPATWPRSTFRLVPYIPHTFPAEHPHAAGVLARIKSVVATPHKRWSVLWSAEGAGLEAAAEREVVMAFEEHSSGFFRPTFTGTLSLSPVLVDVSGLEPSFWVALCCAYADVMEEREGWAAANEGD
ncbi:hypothetical protein JCM10207_000801 [Rhodosporidiobolus poonsookiae]